jgi:plasmid stability protein
MGLIQIRNVPDDVHRRLKARAAEEGVSLSDLLLREAVVLAERPTADELQARLARRRGSGISTKDILRARDADRT